MAANSLYPAFFRIFYHSPRASHIMTVPTREWEGSPTAGLPGNFINWGDVLIPADTMIEDLADLMAAALWTEDVTLDRYVIYSYPAVDADPQPVYGAALGIDGSVVSATWFYAVETTYDWLTTGFGRFKIVALDSPSGDSFEDQNAWFAAGAGAAFNAFVIDEDNALAGRDNEKPTFPQPASRTLNRRLHNKYGRNPF